VGRRSSEAVNAGQNGMGRAGKDPSRRRTNGRVGPVLAQDQNECSAIRIPLLLGSASARVSPVPPTARQVGFRTTTATVVVLGMACLITTYLRFFGHLVVFSLSLPFSAPVWLGLAIPWVWSLSPYLALGMLAWRARASSRVAKAILIGTIVVTVPAIICFVAIRYVSRGDPLGGDNFYLQYDSLVLAPMLQGVGVVFLALLLPQLRDDRGSDVQQATPSRIAWASMLTLTLGGLGASVLARALWPDCNCLLKNGREGLSGLLFFVMLASPYVAFGGIALFFRRDGPASTVVLITMLLFAAPRAFVLASLAASPPTPDGQAGMGLGFILIGATLLEWLGVAIASVVGLGRLPETGRSRALLATVLAILALLVVAPIVFALG